VAQTRKKRRRKHRGTQGGRIDRPRSGRPRSRQEAKARAVRERETRYERPPSWRSATVRGLIAAAIFLVLLLFAFGRPALEAIGFSAAMLVFYIPAGYMMDRWMWRRRERQKIRSGGR
jgi:hypothetical protein